MSPFERSSGTGDTFESIFHQPVAHTRAVSCENMHDNGHLHLPRLRKSGVPGRQPPGYTICYQVPTPMFTSPRAENQTDPGPTATTEYYTTQPWSHWQNRGPRLSLRESDFYNLSYSN